MAATAAQEAVKVNLTELALASNLDGRLELLATVADEQAGHGLWRRWERLEGGWSDWESFSFPIPGLGAELGATWAPAVARNHHGCLEVVVTGSDQEVWRTWQRHPGRAWVFGWESFGRPGGQQTVGSPPALGQNSDGRLELFIADGDGVMWHRWQDKAGSWHSPPGWHSLGKPAEASSRVHGPVVARNSDGRLELFTMNDDSGVVWHCWQRREGSWSAWKSLGGVGATRPGGLRAPVVAQNKDGRLELFTIDVGSTVWHCWQRPPKGWSAWKSLGAPATGALEIGVGAHADGRLMLIAFAYPETEWWQREQAVAGGWSEDWRLLANLARDHGIPTPAMMGQPKLALSADGGLELIAPTAWNTDLYRLWQTSPSGSEWDSAWDNLQPPPPNTVPPTSQPNL
jgi:hypothetical protein